MPSEYFKNMIGCNIVIKLRFLHRALLGVCTEEFHKRPIYSIQVVNVFGRKLLKLDRKLNNLTTYLNVNFVVDREANEIRIVRDQNGIGKCICLAAIFNLLLIITSSDVQGQ